MKISILITYHNEGALLTSCLQSLAEQTIAPFEVLIFDDASKQRPQEYLPTGTSFPISVIRSDENTGPARGRNRLLSKARGEWVHFHDADDLFHPTWCEQVSNKLKSGVDIVFTEVESQVDGQTFRQEVVGLANFGSYGDWVKFSLAHPVLTPTGTFRKTWLLHSGGFNEQLWQSEDYEFHVRTLSNKPAVEVLLEPLIKIRLRANSRSTQSEEVWQCRLQALQHLMELLPVEYYADLCEQFAYVGSLLYRIGSDALAKESFAVAAKLGQPRYSHYPKRLRWLAYWLGPYFIEDAARWYRLLIPQTLRAYLRR